VKAAHARGFRITGHLCAVGFREAGQRGDRPTWSMGCRSIPSYTRQASRMCARTNTACSTKTGPAWIKRRTRFARRSGRCAPRRPGHVDTGCDGDVHRPGVSARFAPRWRLALETEAQISLATTMERRSATPDRRASGPRCWQGDGVRTRVVSAGGRLMDGVVPTGWGRHLAWLWRSTGARAWSRRFTPRDDRDCHRRTRAALPASRRKTFGTVEAEASDLSSLVETRRRKSTMCERRVCLQGWRRMTLPCDSGAQGGVPQTISGTRVSPIGLIGPRSSCAARRVIGVGESTAAAATGTATFQYRRRCWWTSLPIRRRASTRTKRDKFQPSARRQRGAEIVWVHQNEHALSNTAGRSRRPFLRQTRRYAIVDVVDGFPERRPIFGSVPRLTTVRCLSPETGRPPHVRRGSLESSAPA